MPETSGSHFWKKCSFWGPGAFQVFQQSLWFKAHGFRYQGRILRAPDQRGQQLFYGIAHNAPKLSKTFQNYCLNGVFYIKN